MKAVERLFDRKDSKKKRDWPSGRHRHYYVPPQDKKRREEICWPCPLLGSKNLSYTPTWHKPLLDTVSHGTTAWTPQDSGDGDPLKARLFLLGTRAYRNARRPSAVSPRPPHTRRQCCSLLETLRYPPPLSPRRHAQRSSKTAATDSIVPLFTTNVDKGAKRQIPHHHHQHATHEPPQRERDAPRA